MKHGRRIASLVLALVMVLALSVGAFAADFSITVENKKDSISINGNTYSAYRIFDAQYSGSDANAVTYTVSEHFKDFTYKGKSGDELIAHLATLKTDSDQLDAFAKAALAYITEQNIQPDGTAKAADESATIAVPAAGYYLVTGTATAPDNQTVTAACTLTTAKPTASVVVKADAPTVDKKIVEGKQRVSANSASIGESVSFEITSKVPDMKGYNKYYFILNDTLSKGLTYNGDATITVGDKTLAENTDYTITLAKNDADGSTGMVIVFKNFIQYKNQTDAAIKVSYSATLNQDASLDPVAGNPNEVKLTYSNNPNFNYQGENSPEKDEPTGETPKSETKTFTTGLKLTKVDSQGKKLTGAKFQISGEGVKAVLINKEIYLEDTTGDYYLLKNGTYTTTEPNDLTKDSYDSTTTKYKKVTVVTKETVPTAVKAVGYVDKNGILTFEGLGAGEYTITELVAPNGFNLLKDPITITISANETFNNCEWTVKKGEESLTAGADHLFSFKVENNAGTELPSTGGMGTTVFYILGSVLALGAAVVLVTRKRMKEHN